MNHFACSLLLTILVALSSVPTVFADSCLDSADARIATLVRSIQSSYQAVIDRAAFHGGESPDRLMLRYERELLELQQSNTLEGDKPTNKDLLAQLPIAIASLRQLIK